MATANPYTKNTYTGNGSTTAFVFSFTRNSSYDDVVVKTKAADESTFTTMVEDTDYTLSGSTVTFGTAPASGTVITIERCTDPTRLVDFESGTTITDTNLDNDANRLTQITQEIDAGLSDALRLNADGSGWDAEGLPIQNCTAGTNPNDVATVAQVQAIVSGAELADLEGAVLVTLTGDGAETEFELTGYNSLSANQLIVVVEGIIQHGDQDAGTPDYTISQVGDGDYPSGGDGSSDWILFASAPANTARIEVRWLSGTVSTVLGSDSVDNANIADDAVGLEHLDFASGTADRFIVIDANGDPTVTTIGPSKISGFDTQVRTSRLDQMATPTGSISMGSQKITNLGTPTASGDATTKGYSDGKYLTRSRGSGVAFAAVGDWSASVATTGTPDIIHVNFSTTLVADGRERQQCVTAIRVDSEDYEVWMTNTSNEPIYAGRLRIDFQTNAFRVKATNIPATVTWSNNFGYATVARDT